jgi:hypothetical protein
VHFVSEYLDCLHQLFFVLDANSIFDERHIGLHVFYADAKLPIASSFNWIEFISNCWINRAKGTKSMHYDFTSTKRHG